MLSSDIEINTEFLAFPELSYVSVLKKGKTYSQKFRKIHRKTAVLEPFF